MHLTRIVFSLIAFLSCTFSHAQFFKASVIGGGNFAQVDGDHIGGYNKLGLHVGIGINHDITEFKSVGFEMLYAQKGSKLVNDPKATLQPIYIIKSTYIDFPMVYTQKLRSIDAVSLHTGLSLNVNISGTIDDGIRISEAGFNPIEMAFLLGGTYYVNDQLGLRVRHAYSINKISGDLPGNARKFIRTGMYNRWFSVGVVYQLGFSTK